MRLPGPAVSTGGIFLLKKIGKLARGLNDIGADLVQGALLRMDQHAPAEQPQAARRVTIIQFGDYAEAFWRFAGGGSENYYAQKYSMDCLAALAAAEAIENLTVLTFSIDKAAERLPNGVETRGIELYPPGGRPRFNALVAAVKETRPTHLIVMAPLLPVIRFAIRTGIPVLPMFADSFRAGTLRARLQSKTLATLLNHPAIPVVANHNLAASLDLRRIGVDARKIVPFDWPALVSPRMYPAKAAPPSDRPFRLVYVGSVMEAKGVGDAIRAVSALRKRGKEIDLTIVGRGDIESFEQLAVAEGIAPFISFAGPKTHAEVLAAMRSHDAVLVPSHWAYPEGLPMTLYEAICTRTPLITSDHPMFKLKIRDRYNALVVAERSPAALADRIEELSSSSDLYAQLSETGEAAADGYLCPLKYDQMIAAAIDPARRRDVLAYSLAAYPYY